LVGSAVARRGFGVTAMSNRSPVEMASVREAELAWKYQQLKQLRKMLKQAEISRTARHGVKRSSRINPQREHQA
jgi:hypothetical protein